MVIPYRVLQTQCFVALAPQVTGTLILLDDDGWNTKLAQPCPKSNTTLTSANYKNIRLRFVTKQANFFFALLLQSDWLASGGLPALPAKAAIYGAHFARADYRLVLGDRPLVYLFGVAEAAWGNASAGWSDWATALDAADREAAMAILEPTLVELGYLARPEARS
jgi:hypothetical protein